MNILLLESSRSISTSLRSLSCAIGEVTFFTPEEVNPERPEASKIDLIVAGGDFTDHSAQTDFLLAWRTNADTCLVPCWITAEWSGFKSRFLWPRLSIDRFQPGLEREDLCRWLIDAAEWQQNRTSLAEANTLQNQSPLELMTSLALRKSTGRLSVFDEDGADGELSFRDGKLTCAEVKHLRGTEAFHEFFSWTEGAFHWDGAEPRENGADARMLTELIPESLRLIREANILYRFLPNLAHPIERTSLQSVLEVGEASAQDDREKLYELINGKASSALLIEASSLSRSRTMGCLAHWFSLGEVKLAHGELPGSVEASQDTPPHPGPLPPEGEAESSAVPATVDSMPRRLLIVDDSALLCKALQSIFSEDPRFQVIGTARDGVEALEFIQAKGPDVVTLDIQMPRMDGLTALKHIMIRSPKPVVILSAFTEKTSHTTYEAFKYGAVDVLAKPSGFGANSFEKDAREIRDRVAEASGVRIEAVQRIRRTRKAAEVADGDGAMRESDARLPVVVVCCGTGGFSSLLRFLASWSSPREVPSMIACVDMPGKAMEVFAPNMAQDFGFPIEAARSGPLPQGGCVLCAVEDPYRFVRTENGAAFLMPQEPDAQSGAFDRLLSSAAECFGPRVAAFLISGSGDDGLAGLECVRAEEGRTFVLSPEACTKPELPRIVLDRGLAQEVGSAAACTRLLETGRME